jgi:hypothetical protein
MQGANQKFLNWLFGVSTGLGGAVHCWVSLDWVELCTVGYHWIGCSCALLGVTEFICSKLLL